MDIQNYLPTKVISPRANALGENNLRWVIRLYYNCPCGEIYITCHYLF